jgi:molybdate transport system substrate-binding protein
MKRLLAALFLLATALGRTAEAPKAPAGPGKPSVFVAAASDLVFCLEAIHAEFAKAEPDVEVKLSIGSSGNFFAQIKNGSPFDVFLSADVRYPRELIAAKAADEGSLTLYAIGRIVLWTTRTDIDLTDLGAAVRSPRVKKIAIANPAHAPYGRAAQQALEKLGAQTAQFVQTGNADLGIVALSLVLAPTLKNTGKWTLIPEAQHQPLEQAAVITAKGATNPAATRYLAFLRTPAARSIFDRFGFRLPPSP